jgi:hypothetical protein
VDEVSYGLFYDPIQALKLGPKTLWPHGVWDLPWPDPIRKVTMVLYGGTFFWTLQVGTGIGQLLSFDPVINSGIDHLSEDD